MAYLTIAGWLITLALILAGCAPSRTTPPVTAPPMTVPPVVTPEPTPTPTPEPAPVAPTPTPVPPAPPVVTGPVLTIIPNHLIVATPDPMGYGAMAIQIRLADPNGTVRVRMRAPDGSYPVNEGGEHGRLVSPTGGGVGPLPPGSSFEVLDGDWFTFARYQ
ncbi:hypothetical protein [Deinococcus sp.]|uniref:hypothetical protein n=1 Tax=Deinococcus sp. TaxID=47478 RepID=UPI0025C662C4|nr:hypothetical protein [Deinococcus sp.]